MTEAKQKAKEMVDKWGVTTVKNRVKMILNIRYEFLQLDPTEANSHAFQYWGDVMDELNEME